jgi:hypothetical protein
MFPLEIFCLIRSLGVAENDKGEARVGRLKFQALGVHT